MRPEGLERWVVNLTDRALTPAQEEVLKLGLNFAPAPSKLPLTDTMAAVESGARRLSPEDADDLRGRVCAVFFSGPLGGGNFPPKVFNFPPKQ